MEISWEPVPSESLVHCLWIILRVCSLTSFMLGSINALFQFSQRRVICVGLSAAWISASTKQVMLSKAAAFRSLMNVHKQAWRHTCKLALVRKSTLFNVPSLKKKINKIHIQYAHCKTTWAVFNTHRCDTYKQSWTELYLHLISVTAWQKKSVAFICFFFLTFLTKDA